jgi:hypothetical protein
MALGRQPHPCKCAPRRRVSSIFFHQTKSEPDHFAALSPRPIVATAQLAQHRSRSKEELPKEGSAMFKSKRSIALPSRTLLIDVRAGKINTVRRCHPGSLAVRGACAIVPPFLT